MDQAKYAAAMNDIQRVREASPEIYLELNCQREGGEDYTPRWLKFKLDAEMVDQLIRLETIRASHGLDQVTVRVGPEYGPSAEDEEPRIRGDRLVVEAFGSDATFYFSGYEKYTEVDFHSHWCYLPEFFTEVAGGRRFFSDGMSEEEFKAEVEEDDTADADSPA